MVVVAVVVVVVVAVAEWKWRDREVKGWATTWWKSFSWRSRCGEFDMCEGAPPRATDAVSPCVDRNRVQTITSKLGDLLADTQERARVRTALGEVDAERECYRLVGEVLVRRAVRDVIAELEVEAGKMAELIANLEKERERDALEAQRLMAKHSQALEQLNRRGQPVA